MPSPPESRPDIQSLVTRVVVVVGVVVVMVVVAIVVVAVVLAVVVVVAVIIIVVALKDAIRDSYNLLTAARTVFNTYAQVAWAQSCANHVQHIERLSRATFRVIRGSLIMFCNLVFQQHLQPLCLLQFSQKPPSVCTHLATLLNQLSMTPDHVDWVCLK